MSLSVIVLGVILLYMMLKLPVYEYRIFHGVEGVTRKDEEDVRRTCLWLHGLQVVCFLISFVFLTIEILRGS